LGQAILLVRGSHRSGGHFRSGNKADGIGGNHSANSLFGMDISHEPKGLGAPVWSGISSLNGLPSDH
jgi:hypothetical protein